MPTAPLLPRRSLYAGLAATILMLSGCGSDHLDIPPPNPGPAPAPKGVSAKVASDIGDKERAANDPAGAVVFYRQALAIDPAQPKVRLSLAKALAEAGAPNDAADMFRQVLAAEPKNAEAEIGLGAALLQLGQPAQALEPLRKGLPAAPEPRGYRALGIAENLTGDNEAAEADYRRGLALAPADQALRSNLGLSLALSGKFDEAIATLRAAAAAPDATAKTRGNLALALGLAGRPDEAAQVARTDLDEQSVQSNLAFYAQLRAMPPQQRTDTLLRPAPR
jgi:Flp pilus assembly protein TadD